eukprot:TRINITY_DN157_c0_g1_i17.p1 TRINITY_DN157_c0_g1~~TRINITY_DN157_c0_g1_i17.p1  ORF type:complete len:137 (-),score=40.85 TRINITY_DN157_c0_g1_i17:542-952(-)
MGMLLCNCTQNPKKASKKQKNVEQIVKETYEFLEADNYDELRFRFFPKGFFYFNLPLNNVGLTIFLLAVIEERKSLVEMLLSDKERRKGLVMQRDIYKNNALHLAAYGRDKELARMLIEAGVDADAANNVVLRTYR